MTEDKCCVCKEENMIYFIFYIETLKKNDFIKTKDLITYLNYGF